MMSAGLIQHKHVSREAGLTQKQVLVGLSQWFLNLNVHHLPDLLKHRLLGSTPRISYSMGLSGVREFVSGEAETAGLRLCFESHCLSQPRWVVPFSLPVIG